ncbi:MAG: sigma 54 modulation/S30EA ribosomal C-terminal domain-containing protein [Elusimicrobiota bacterium]
MDRMGYSFWMFMNDDSRQVNVIYRRMDDTYGLLQPVKKRT